jgi:hypothetical protein
MLAAIMKKSDTQQRRAARRFPLQDPIRLSGRTLPLVVGPTRSSRLVDGHVQNISSGGLCLLAQKRLNVSELLVGEIGVPGTRARIPTLLQVRWLRRNSVGVRYCAGLQFVLRGGITQSLQTSARIAELTATGQGIRRISPKGN